MYPSNQAKSSMQEQVMLAWLWEASTGCYEMFLTRKAVIFTEFLQVNSPFIIEVRSMLMLELFQPCFYCIQILICIFSCDFPNICAVLQTQYCEHTYAGTTNSSTPKSFLIIPTKEVVRWTNVIHCIVKLCAEITYRKMKMGNQFYFGVFDRHWVWHHFYEIKLHTLCLTGWLRGFPAPAFAHSIWCYHLLKI